MASAVGVRFVSPTAKAMGRPNRECLLESQSCEADHRSLGYGCSENLYLRSEERSAGLHLKV